MKLFQKKQLTKGFAGITAVAALAYMMFHLFTPPCFAALGAMNSDAKVKAEYALKNSMA